MSDQSGLRGAEVGFEWGIEVGLWGFERGKKVRDLSGAKSWLRQHFEFEEQKGYEMKPALRLF